MGDLQYAALDPLFYAHHGNIHRLWEVWKSLPGGSRKDLSQADFLNTQFLFYDENAALVKVQISQALNINNFRSGLQTLSSLSALLVPTFSW
jgi:polyphenol oxidase